MPRVPAKPGLRLGPQDPTAQGGMLRWFCSSGTPSHPGAAVEPGSAPCVPHYWVDPSAVSPPPRLPPAAHAAGLTLTWAAKWKKIIGACLIGAETPGKRDTGQGGSDTQLQMGDGCGGVAGPAGRVAGATATWVWRLLAMPRMLPCLRPCSLWDVPKELQPPVFGSCQLPLPDGRTWVRRAWCCWDTSGSSGPSRPPVQSCGAIVPSCQSPPAHPAAAFASRESVRRRKAD